MHRIAAQSDIEWLRKQPAKISDGELLKTGKSLKDLVNPKANFNRPPNPFVIQIGRGKRGMAQTKSETEIALIAL